MKRIDELSLGWRTDLIFPRFDAQVIQRPGHIVVRTPHNPTFYWGNFLLFDHAPRDGDAAPWLAAFEQEIAREQPQSRHLAFGIDTPDPWAMPADFAAAGLVLDQATVLSLQPHRLRPPRRDIGPSFNIRPLDLPREQTLAVENQVASDTGGFEPSGYRSFRERQMQRYGAMAAAGRGHWFGVFAGTPAEPQLAADCGLFSDGGSLGRFQFVTTHPAWRRRGLCTALIHAVCSHGFEAMGLLSLVIVADPEDVAIVLYESLGFERGVTTWQLERRPVEDPP
jgi:RimJ/RimL family protein N-acetyltransferase